MLRLNDGGQVSEGVIRQRERRTQGREWCPKQVEQTQTRENDCRIEVVSCGGIYHKGYHRRHSREGESEGVVDGAKDKTTV